MEIVFLHLWINFSLLGMGFHKVFEMMKFSTYVSNVI